MNTLILLAALSGTPEVQAKQEPPVVQKEDSFYNLQKNKPVRRFLSKVFGYAKRV